jgi:inner membrane protein involved in colicin E2 resistance
MGTTEKIFIILADFTSQWIINWWISETSPLAEPSALTPLFPILSKQIKYYIFKNKHVKISILDTTKKYKDTKRTSQFLQIMTKSGW